MILTIPKKVEYLHIGEYKIKDNSPLKIKETRNGIAVYENGEQVALVCKSPASSSVVLAGLGRLTLTKNGTGITFSVPPKCDEEGMLGRYMGDTFEKDEFVFIGNADEAHYFVYRTTEGKDPVLFLNAVAHPLDDRLVNIEVPASEDAGAALALAIAIN